MRRPIDFQTVCVNRFLRFANATVLLCIEMGGYDTNYLGRSATVHDFRHVSKRDIMTVSPSFPVACDYGGRVDEDPV
jgi:hypothetical protein